MRGIPAHLWGKAADEDAYHPLLCHLLDVGATAEAIVGALAPTVRTDLESLADLGSLAAWCALHDLGKASPAFQAKRMDLAERLDEEGLKVGSALDAHRAPHGLVTLWTLPEVLRPYGGDPVGVRRLASVLAAHHGLFPTATQALAVHRSLAGTGDWTTCRAALAKHVLDAFGAAPPQKGITITDAVVLAGLCSVADWVGSNRSWFPYTPSTGVDARTYLAQARERAAAALDELYWRPWTPRFATFGELFTAAPRPLQAAVEAVAGDLCGPSLVLVEAPMGEGKTEAAFLVAQALAARNSYGGLYFALPTQATANQMLLRMRAFLEATLPGEVANLHLLHGTAWLSPTAKELLSGATTEMTGVEDDGDPRGRVVAAEWFTHRKRGLLSPFGVGTVDQVLLAGLRTKHVFVRLFGLAGKVVVLDEVHAYDTYMTTVLDRTIAWLGALGASVVVLSATLPARRRRELLAAWRRGAGAAAEPTVEINDYPAVVVSDRQGIRVSAPSAFREQTFDLSELPGSLANPDDAAHLATSLLDTVAGGGCLGVVCNTVSGAQALFRALLAHDEAEEVWTVLAHSRFCAEDRALWEDRLRQQLGPPPDSMRPARAIVVATQVIEQSVDLDFDLLVTELAPIDLVFQRMGRLHRHHRPRPSRWSSPTCWWLGPPLDAKGAPVFERWPTAYVYAPHLLLRSWLVARSRQTVSFPGDLRYLIEAVYGDEDPEVPADLQELWRSTAEDLRRSLADAEAQAKSRFLPPPMAELDPSELSWSPSIEDDDAHPDVQALTRLGPPSTSVVCLWGLDGTPSLTREGTRPVDLAAVPGPEEARQLLGRALPLAFPRSRQGLAKALAAQTPPAWRDSPWLASARLLRLDTGGARVRIGGLDVTLDERLGLVIERPSSPR